MFSEKFIIYGTSWNAVKCIWKIGIEHILLFVDEKKNVSQFYGKPVRRTEDALAIRKREYILVASSESTYLQIKKFLENFGLIEFEDFIFYELFRKKIALIYGNCHTIPIKEGLRLNRKFYEEYSFYPLKPIQDIKRDNTSDYNFPVFERSDLFIHQNIRENNSYGPEYASKHLLRRLKPSCKVIAIPNVYKIPKCFFPQTYEGKVIERGGIKLFPFRDTFVDQLYEERNSIEKIVSILNQDTFIDRKKIHLEWDVFYDKVRKREYEWDVKLSDFLIENYREQQLFYDQNHPTNVMIQYFVVSILKILYSDIIIDERLFENLLRLDTYEIPIYNSVAKALDLRYKKCFFREYSKNKIWLKAMDFEEYIRQYIIWNFSEPEAALK